MEIKAARDDLLNCLECVKDAASATNINPILSNVLIVSAGGDATMVATNNEVQIKTDCLVQCDGNFKKILPAAKLQSILRVLDSDNEVHIKFKKSEAEIRSGQSKFKLMTQSADAFSLLGETEEMAVLETVPAKQIKDALKKVSYASARQSHRMSLNGVLIERSVDGIHLVATDGHRMATQTMKREKPEKAEKGEKKQKVKETQQILPRRTVDILAARLGGDGDLEISANDRTVKFKTGEFEIITNVIDENYPDYRSVIPRNHDKKASIPRGEFHAAMRRALALSEPGGSATFKFGGNRLDIETLNKNNDSLADQLDIDYTGEALKVGFNINFILDVLGVMEDDTIILSMKENTSSALIKGGGDDTFSYVVMPIHI